MTQSFSSIIADIEHSAREDGLEHHLEAVRELARDRVDVDTIDAMMRFMFTRPQLEALVWEAAQARIGDPLPAGPEGGTETPRQR